MGKPWTVMSVLLCACAGAQAPQPTSVAGAPGDLFSGVEVSDATSEPKSTSESAFAAATSAGKGKSSFVASEEQPGCTVRVGVPPKVVSGEDSVSESAETGQALVFEMAGIGVEFPACTPEADVRVITVSWETKERPTSSRIHPDFTRHAATVRVDHAIGALSDAPLLVRLHSKRELVQRGEKLVLAVESSGECTARNKRDALDDGGCSYWELYDTTYDAEAADMVARIPALGGYRLQFGWMPSK